MNPHKERVFNLPSDRFSAIGFRLLEDRADPPPDSKESETPGSTAHRSLPPL